MKKLFFIALIGVAAISANAQPISSANHNDPRHPAIRHSDDRRMIDRRIAEINRTYDARINAVKHDRGLRASAKRKKIRRLEKERTVAINECRNNVSHPYVSGIKHH